MSWIKLHYKLIDWRWYSDTNTLAVWIHILMGANWKEKDWKGISVPRGSLITSREHLAKECGLTVMQARLALKHLQDTQEITIKTTNKYTMISVCKFDDYQANNILEDLEDNQQISQQITNKQPTNNQQITTTKEYKNNRIEDNKDTSIVVSDTAATTTQQSKDRRAHLVETLNKRMAAFASDVKAHTEYDAEELDRFVEYWTEPNKSKTQMRYERENTWDLSRRLARWFRNKPFAQRSVTTPQPIEYTDDNRPHHFKQGGKYWNANQKRWFDE